MRQSRFLALAFFHIADKVLQDALREYQCSEFRQLGGGALVASGIQGGMYALLHAKNVTPGARRCRHS
jgi:hypothetical protein